MARFLHTGLLDPPEADGCDAPRALLGAKVGDIAEPDRFSLEEDEELLGTIDLDQVGLGAAPRADAVSFVVISLDVLVDGVGGTFKGRNAILGYQS